MRRILYVVMGMSIGLIIACATAPKRPAWVYKGGAAFPSDEGVYIYGVGVSSKSPNLAAMRERAEHRARLQIARSIKTYVAALLKDFMTDYPDYFNPDAAGSEEYLERVSKEVVEATLYGVQIVDHWTDPKDGTLYALARARKDEVDNIFKERLRMIKGLLLKEKTEEALKQLDEELKKLDLREKSTLEKYFKPAPEG